MYNTCSDILGHSKIIDIFTHLKRRVSLKTLENKAMPTNLILATIAIIAFLGITFYCVFTIDDKSAKTP
jgi:hypothetical protein